MGRRNENEMSKLGRASERGKEGGRGDVGRRGRSCNELLFPRGNDLAGKERRKEGRKER